MTDLFKTLKAKRVTLLDRAGPGRVIGQRGTDLVALTKDGRKELWRLPLPSKEEGYTFADKHTILWNARGERRLLIAVAAADGRELYVLEGEWARVLEGDRFLALNGDGMGSLRRTESGELIVSLPGLADGPFHFSPDRRLLVAGCWPAQVWDLEEAKLRFSFDTNSSTAQVEFTPDGASLVVTEIMTPQSGMEDEITKRTYDVRTGNLVDKQSWWERQG